MVSRRHVASLLCLTVLIGLGVSACAPEEQSGSLLEVDPDSPLGLPKLIGLEPIVKDETLVLDDTALTDLDTVELLNGDACLTGEPSRDLCEYRLGFAVLPDGVEVGSVLVAGVSALTPAGILVVVSAVDGTTVLATEGSLGDALEQGEFRMERAFTVDDVVSQQNGPGVTGGADVGTVAYRGDTVDNAAGVDFSYDIDTDIVDGVHATGAVGFNVGCGAYGGLTWETLLGVPIYPNGVYFEGKCGVSQNASLTLTGTAGATLEESFEVTRLNLSAITFMIGPVPVVLVPQVVVTINAKGEVAAEMSVGVAQSFAITAGIRYSDGFQLIKEFDSDFSKSVSDVTTRVSATAGVELTESLLLYGIAGPSMVEEAYLDLEGKPMGEKPIWCLTGGLRGSAKISLDLTYKQLDYGPAELFDTSTELGCAANTAPRLTIQSRVAGATVYPGTANGNLVLGAQAWDEEDGNLTTHWSSSLDGDLGTTANGKTLTVTDLSLGSHTITATTTDDDGSTTTKTVQITAKDGSPSVAFTAKDSAGDWYTLTTLSGLKGEIAYVRLVPSSPVMLTYTNCDKVTFAGSLPVARVSNCDFSISLNQQGTFPVTATLTDSDGKSGTSTLSVKVGAAPAVVTPQFSQITARGTGGRGIPDGGYIDSGEASSLAVSYTNASTASKNVTYSWSMRTTQIGGTPGSWTALGTTDSPTLQGSTRTFTASTAFAKNYRYEFSVTMKDAATGTTLGTRTFTMVYSGPPA